MKFPNCLGVLDGFHIQIVKPAFSESLYYNYKGYFCRRYVTQIPYFARSGVSQIDHNSETQHCEQHSKPAP